MDAEDAGTGLGKGDDLPVLSKQGSVSIQT